MLKITLSTVCLLYCVPASLRRCMFPHALIWKSITTSSPCHFQSLTIRRMFLLIFLYWAQTCLLTNPSAPWVAVSKRNPSSHWQHFSYFPLKYQNLTPPCILCLKTESWLSHENPLSSTSLCITRPVSSLTPKQVVSSTTLSIPAGMTLVQSFPQPPRNPTIYSPHRGQSSLFAVFFYCCKIYIT